MFINECTHLLFDSKIILFNCYNKNEKHNKPDCAFIVFKFFSKYEESRVYRDSQIMLWMTLKQSSRSKELFKG